MEFKGDKGRKKRIWQDSRDRNRVEFKGHIKKSLLTNLLVEIGTEWNLKLQAMYLQSSLCSVEIGTEWNLKQEYYFDFLTWLCVEIGTEWNLKHNLLMPLSFHVR